MKIKILHLYHDLMNLYGEYGNVRAITRFLTEAGVEVEIEEKSLGETLEFTDCDLLYLGAGTEENQKVVLEHLGQVRPGFIDYINGDGFALFTGNSFEILGKSITEDGGNVVPGLNLFSFETIVQKKRRMTGDAIFSLEDLREPLVGFINKCSEIKDNDYPCFAVEMGLEDEKGKKQEGLRYKNLTGTHLTGPLLVKNPHFLFYLGKKLFQIKTGESLDEEKEAYLREHIFKDEFAAYETTLRELRKRNE